MAKTWKVILKNAGRYNIEGITLDYERGIPFIDDFWEKGNYPELNKAFLSDLVETLKALGHYQVFKGMEVISPNGDIITEETVPLGAIIAFTEKDKIIGFLYLLTDNGMEILGLWPSEFANSCKKDEKLLWNEIAKLVGLPYYFKMVSFLFPKYYPY